MLQINKSFQINQIKNSLTDLMGISLFVARLDEIHSIISGNKIFKLHHFIDEAIENNHDTIITFGGAYSNHLVATAYYANSIGMKSIGVVRGEKPDTLSHTLIDCMNYEMELIFVSREEYKNKDKKEFINQLLNGHSNATIIPEGGYHPLGAKGASLIMDTIHEIEPSHIAVAVGTATTMAGLLLNKKNDQEIIAVPVIKNMTDIYSRLEYLSQNNPFIKPVIFNDYHFGGYAKYDESLLNFMLEFYREHKIKTDFVYTGKMFFAVMEKIKAGYFKKGSRVVCIHTGGLQGNFSLNPSSVFFN